MQMKSGIGSSTGTCRGRSSTPSLRNPGANFARIALKTTGNNQWVEEFSTNQLFAEIFIGLFDFCFKKFEIRHFRFKIN